MRTFKLIGFLIVVLAFSAMAVATASAVETLWRWLPGAAGETFTGASGKATLQIEEGPKGEKPGASITCTKSTVLLAESKLTSPETAATLGEAQIHFSGCTAVGLSVLSLGDLKEAGVILTHVKLHNCLIKKEDFGIIFEPDEVKLEVPATKLAIAVKGSFVGLISPAAKSQKGPFTLTIEQKEGKQTIKLCEGGANRTLLSSINGGAFGTSGEEAKEGSITFDKVAQEIMI